MSGHTVRQQFLQQFRGLSTNSRRVSVLIVASYFTQLVGAIGLGYWLLQFPLTIVSGFGVAVVMFFIGTRLRGFNNIVHECCHYSFSEKRADNATLGSICASLVLGSFRDYRDEHMTHHAHLGDYEKDLDLQGIRHFKLEDPLTSRTILRHLLTPILGLHLRHYVSINLGSRDGKAYWALKIVIVAAAIAFLILDPVAALLLVWVPFLWVYTAINYWMDCIDHAGLVDSGDELHASRNCLLPRQLSVILFPRNDCYHLIHHLFPQVPTHHFAACHGRLMGNPEYRARVEGEGSGRQTSVGDGEPIAATRAVAH